MNKYIRPLNKLTKSDTQIAGGKAANLGELISAGFNVANGFCVPTAAYNDFIAQPKINEHINCLLKDMNRSDPERVKSYCKDIRQIISAQKIPVSIESAIKESYKRFFSIDSNLKSKGIAVAVRSSEHISEIIMRVKKRKKEWKQYHSINAPFVVRSDGKTIESSSEPAPDSQILRGTSASFGKATGKARIIMDPDDGCTFNKDEILVAPCTDPGWTPLFLTAKALVMEIGGVISHGAIVAREYGIPAVVGVKNATKYIRTGDVVTVNGNNGSVQLEENCEIT